jgi:hypothetical protein
MASTGVVGAPAGSKITAAQLLVITGSHSTARGASRQLMYRPEGEPSNGQIKCWACDESEAEP